MLEINTGGGDMKLLESYGLKIQGYGGCFNPEEQMLYKKLQNHIYPET